MTGCDQCEAVSINGVACHEQGCPNSWIDPATGDPYPVECTFCGSLFEPETRGQRYCDEECQAAYYG